MSSPPLHRSERSSSQLPQRLPWHPRPPESLYGAQAQPKAHSRSSATATLANRYTTEHTRQCRACTAGQRPLRTRRPESRANFKADRRQGRSLRPPLMHPTYEGSRMSRGIPMRWKANSRAEGGLISWVSLDPAFRGSLLPHMGCSRVQHNFHRSCCRCWMGNIIRTRSVHDLR